MDTGHLPNSWVCQLNVQGQAGKYVLIPASCIWLKTGKIMGFPQSHGLCYIFKLWLTLDSSRQIELCTGEQGLCTGGKLGCAAASRLGVVAPPVKDVSAGGCKLPLEAITKG